VAPGGVVAGGVVAGGVVAGGVVAGGVVAGGVVGGGGSGMVVDGVVRGVVVDDGGVGVVVVSGTWAPGLVLLAAAWELDVSPRPRARLPATRTAITPMMIPSRLVTCRPLELWWAVAVRSLTRSRTA
jgi:hypothetical protein